MTPPNMQGLWFTEVHKDIVAMGFHIENVLFSGRSSFQQVDILQTAGHGRMLVNDGMVMLSERDEFIYHEMIAHVPLFVHPKPQRVLVVGGGDGGTVREVVKHETVQRVVMVEIDELVVRTCREYLPSVACALDHPKVELLIADGVKYVAESEERFDVILVDSTDPVGPAEPLFDRDFYGNVAGLLADGGILVTQAESPYYDHDLQFPMLQNQRPLFKKLHLYHMANMTYPSGLWSFGFATDGPDPLTDALSERVAGSGISFRYYNPGIHRAAFMLPTFVAEELKGVVDPVGWE